MIVSGIVAGTPQYVLMNENRRIGPKTVPLPSGIECTPIYGFSYKVAYDKFCSNSDLELQPYPLVKCYLRDEIAARGCELKLVIVDATGPGAACLHAATMENVLEAHDKRTTQVAAAYRLTFDNDANAYRIGEAAI